MTNRSVERDDDKRRHRVDARSRRLAAFAALAALVCSLLAVGIVLNVGDTVNVLDALSAFVWPLVVVWIAYRVLPPLVEVVRSRKFQVEVFGVKLNVDDAIEQTSRQVQALLSNEATDAPEHAGGGTPPASAPDDRRTPGRILWVDDRPSANVFEKRTLRDAGWAIVEAESTSQAIELSRGDWSRFDVVVTDMGRDEDGAFVADAGLRLIRLIRETNGTVPVIIYTGSRGLAKRPEAMAAGATGLTSNPTELLSMIRRAAGMPR